MPSVIYKINVVNGSRNLRFSIYSILLISIEGNSCEQLRSVLSPIKEVKMRIVLCVLIDRNLIRDCYVFGQYGTEGQ